MTNQRQEPKIELLYCDECGAETDDPWHYSEGDNKHYHRCNTCHNKFQKTWVIGEYNMDDLTDAIFRSVNSSSYDVCVTIGAFEKAMVESTKARNKMNTDKYATKYQTDYSIIQLKELQNNQLFHLADGTFVVYRVLFNKEGKVYAEVHEGDYKGLACAFPEFLHCFELEYKQ